MTTQLSTLIPTAQARVVPIGRLLAPICAVVFLEFLAMGLPLAILPVHVHDTLGYGSWVVGLALGAQAWATLLTRHGAGTWADQRGPRSATILGLALSGLAGVLYLVSSTVAASLGSLVVLVAGRLVLGLGESLVITGALAWGVALAGRERSGLVMSWVGIAMYGALAAGAPLGVLLEGQLGFMGMAAAAAVAPLAALLVVGLARAVAPVGGARLPFYRVVGLIWLPGVGLMLSALGFGAIAAFSALRFGEAGWAHAALPMTAFGAAYVLARLLLGGLPDRLGGARIAMASAAVAALGQVGLWLASSEVLAVGAAALTGLGFSLAFPAFGVEAMRGVPPQSRGVALGAYAACFDVTMGLGVPLLGLVVAFAGYGAAFATSALAALASLAIAAVLAARAARSAS
jgi:MFS family permease